MNKYIILPDVTCDLSPEIREHFGMCDYVHGYVHIDGEQVKTTLDWENVERDKFYKMLGSKKHTISSAAASPEEYYQIFRKYAEEGYDIISMSLSSKISVTYNTANNAVARVQAEFPERKIVCVDTLRMSGSFGLLVAYACELQKEGKSFDEVVEWLLENRHRVHQMGPIDDLTFIARRGRISKGKAIMGNLIGIKPMGDSNADGYVTVLAKVKGVEKALNVTVEYLKTVATDIENNYVFIMHSDRERYANSLSEKIKNAVNCKGVFVSDVYSGCGTNIGPGMISCYFMGEPVSEDSEKEKEALNSAIEKFSK